MVYNTAQALRKPSESLSARKPLASKSNSRARRHACVDTCCRHQLKPRTAKENAPWAPKTRTATGVDSCEPKTWRAKPSPSPSQTSKTLSLTTEASNLSCTLREKEGARHQLDELRHFSRSHQPSHARLGWPRHHAQGREGELQRQACRQHQSDGAETAGEATAVRRLRRRDPGRLCGLASTTASGSPQEMFPRPSMNWDYVLSLARRT
jgi:hypothetical protein